MKSIGETSNNNNNLSDSDSEDKLITISTHGNCESYDTLNRKEMLWDTKIETLFRHWAIECKEKSEQHNKKAKLKKCLHRSLAIPSVVIPILMATMTQIIEDETVFELKVTNAIGYLLTGTLTGINTFLNYSSQYEKHYNAEVRYHELYVDIQSTLIKPKRDRIQADVSLENFRLKFEHINEMSPDL